MVFLNIFIATLFGLFGNIIATWMEPRLKQNKIIVVVIFLVLFCITFFISQKLTETISQNKIEELVEKCSKGSFPLDEAHLQEIGSFAFDKYKIVQIFSLDEKNCGINGALLIVLDKYVKGISGGLEYNGVYGLLTPSFRFNDDNYELMEKNIEQARIILIDDKLNVLYQELLGRYSARLDKVSLYDDLLKPSFVLTVDNILHSPSYSGPSTVFFEIKDKKFTYLFDKQGFMISKIKSWAIKENKSIKNILFVDSYSSSVKNIEYLSRFGCWSFNKDNWKLKYIEKEGYWFNPKFNEDVDIIEDKYWFNKRFEGEGEANRYFSEIEEFKELIPN